MNRRLLTGSLAITVAVTLGLGVLESEAGPVEGLKHYVDHEFDAAIAACEKGKDIMSKIVFALAYTEKYNIYKNKLDKQQASIYLKLLGVELDVGHAMTVEKFLDVPGNMNGNKEAVKLLKISFKNAQSTPEHILLIARFLDPAKGEASNKLAASEIGKRLKPVRDYVNKGGTMPDEMRNEVFTNEELIVPLVNALSVKATESGAKKCLTIIEEPCLEVLEAQDLTKPVSDTIVAIKKAIAKRLTKFADSTWYSASGN